MRLIFSPTVIVISSCFKAMDVSTSYIAYHTR
nr:MAG TPA: hypothetical protein [Caudoviricetes sp.]